jgi:hypothetical protein
MVRRRSGARRRGPRSRTEVDAERQKLHDETNREIDAVVAEFHALLPRERARCVGAIYARYSSKYQHSITDQVRGCLQTAVQQGIHVPREFVFADLAIRGAKQRRPGLDRLKLVLAHKAVKALLILTTNRLSRKTYKALQFVEEEVVGRGIRALFVKSGVDTADEKRWRMLLNHYAAIDEFVSSMYADNIRVAHEGLFAQRLVFGTITFGYKAEEVAGPPTLQKRPRCQYAIDPEAAPWVVKIYRWFAEDRLPLAEILRRLNADPTVPLGPKAVSGRWTRQALKLLLTNPRYRGLWSYGRMETIWQPAQDYARQFPRERPLAEEDFEELRLVSDELWYAAQERLLSVEANGGRKPTDGDRKRRPLLLNGLFACAAHGQRLYVGGVHGRTMFCPVCRDLPAAERPLFSQLNRELALRVTCHKLVELIRADAALTATVVEAVWLEAEALQKPDPTRLTELKKCEERLTQQIKFILGNAGETQAEQDESAVELRRLRAERTRLEAERSALEGRDRQPHELPDEAQILSLLAEMGDILGAAATGADSEGFGAAREVIELLIDGRIELTQQGERKPQRGWLRGRFRVNVLNGLVGKLLGETRVAGESAAVVEIDFRDPPEVEQWVDRVKGLYDRGLLVKAIAAELGINRNLVRDALAVWFARRGERSPDGRSRRAQLERKHLEPPLYQRVAERVKELETQGRLLQDIASELGLALNTVTRALAFWRDNNGEEREDGRSRRKRLPPGGKGMGRTAAG